jgi:hypothetical protein
MKDYWYEVPPSETGDPDTHLFFINTVVWLGKESFPFNWLGSDIKSGQREEQERWLVDRLSKSKARVKLVFGHHGIYSVGPHGGRIRLENLDRILRSHGVTAYVNGHDHCLYHISRDGMHYICSGAGSEVLTGFTGGTEPGCVLPGACDPQSLDRAYPVWHAFLSIAGFAAFEIAAGRVAFQFIDMSGQVRHSFAL